MARFREGHLYVLRRGGRTWHNFTSTSQSSFFYMLFLLEPAHFLIKLISRTQVPCLPWYHALGRIDTGARASSFSFRVSVFQCVSMTREQALQQAQAEGVTLRMADNKSGYANVSRFPGDKPKPYMAQVRRCMQGYPSRFACCDLAS